MDFETFANEQYDRVLRTAVLLAGNRDDAVELTQEAFARALARWGAVKRMEAPGAWVHRVLVNLVRRRWRRRGMERERLEIVARSSVPEWVDPEIALRLTLRDALR